MNQSLQPIFESTEQELEIYVRIRPFIAHCLTLNHELNNALAGIIGYAEFLASEPADLSDDQQNNLRQILVCAERIQSVVEKLSQEKIELGQQIDLKSVTAAYQSVARPLQ